MSKIVMWIKKHIVVSIIIAVVVIGGSVIVGSNLLSSINLEGNITNVEYLKFILPSDFEEVSLEQWNEKLFKYNSSLGACDLRIKVESDVHNPYQTTEEWLLFELNYYYNDDDFVAENEKPVIGDKVINKHSWKTYENNPISYTYVIKYNGDFYEINFFFNGTEEFANDKSSYCYKAHNTIVNTLDFK